MSSSYGVISQRTGDGTATVRHHSTRWRRIPSVQSKVAFDADSSLERWLFLRRHFLWLPIKTNKMAQFFGGGDYFQAARCNCQPFFTKRDSYTFLSRRYSSIWLYCSDWMRAYIGAREHRFDCCRIVCCFVVAVDDLWGFCLIDTKCSPGFCVLLFAEIAKR